MGLVLLTVSVNAQTDSLRLEIEGEKAYVIHKVLAKQTLYSLARRYQTSVDAINAENPTLVNGLQVGQTLKIPYGGPINTKAEEPDQQFEYSVHKVKAGETLFSISRDYEVSISDLKAWNQLESNSISLDQELKIRVVVEAAETQEGESTVSTEVPVSEDPTEESKPEEVTERENDKDSLTYQGTAFQQFVVEGIAEVISEDEPSSKFFALHRTAKEGTVIKVRNLMNDLTVYVRVVGTIPETSTNEDVIIKLNQRAYENLKAIDKRFRVELSYFQ